LINPPLKPLSRNYPESLSDSDNYATKGCEATPCSVTVSDARNAA
jgi:hypothetical protein